MAETITLRRLGPDDLDLLLVVEDGLFDDVILPEQAKVFLNDPLHEMVIAQTDGEVVGMASGQVLYHPDKPPSFFIAEVGVRDAFQRRGIATQMCRMLRDIAQERGCVGIWVATEGDNGPARALYRSLGARETSDVVIFDWDDPEMDT
jgi:ribosomal protein S18 acetylase RimI-like enzyme